MSMQNAAMTAIFTALRAGLEPATLRMMVDAASTALQLTEERGRPAEGAASPAEPSGEVAAAGPSAEQAGQSRADSAAQPGRSGDAGASRGEDSAAEQKQPNGWAGRISLRIKMKHGEDGSSSGEHRNRNEGCCPTVPETAALMKGSTV